MQVFCCAGGEVCDLSLQQARSDSNAGPQYTDLGTAIWKNSARPHSKPAAHSSVFCSNCMAPISLYQHEMTTVRQHGMQC